jgi:hypothetical protein
MAKGEKYLLGYSWGRPELAQAWDQPEALRGTVMAASLIPAIAQFLR